MLKVCVGKGQGEGRTDIALYFVDISVCQASGILGMVSARLSNGRRRPAASNRSVLCPLCHPLENCQGMRFSRFAHR